MAHWAQTRFFFFLWQRKRRSRWPGVMQSSNVWQQARKGHADIISHRRRSSSIHSVDKSLLASQVTHTLSRSMSWLCRSLPSVVKRSLKSLIWSASSGFRLNSAGNSEIQYLAGNNKGANKKGGGWRRGYSREVIVCHAAQHPFYESVVYCHDIQ